MLIRSVVVVLAWSVTFVTSAFIKENSPTHVPKRCFLDKAQGSCHDYSRSYYFNVTAGHCQAFVYGGCEGNWNRFNSQRECHKTCTCATPPETGPCRGHIRRWFYSPADGCCRPFIYGGCGGNTNSYVTWTECSNMCGYPTAGSNWWSWGARFGNRSSGTQKANTAYSRNDFMRDWMLWNMLAGGEGLEIEGLATQIGQAHILNMANSGAGSGMSGQGAAGGYFGNSGWESGQQSSGMANWGPTYNTGKPGSFTPLGHVGSIANLINTGVNGEMTGFGTWDQMTAGGLGGAAQGWGVQGQPNWASGGQGSELGFFNQGFGGESGWNGAMGAGLSGQSHWGSRGQGSMGQGTGGLMHGNWNSGGMGNGQFPDWSTGVTGSTGHGQIGSWNTGQTGGPSLGHDMGNAAMEILYLVGQLGRGALQPSDLIGLAERFGAIGPTGNINIHSLATRMVGDLQGPKGAMNIARLKSVAQSLGALDNNGNINIPLMVKGITENLTGLSNNAGVAGLPSLDEFAWLGSGKTSIGGRVGVGGGAGGKGVGRLDTGSGPLLGGVGVGGEVGAGGVASSGRWTGNRGAGGGLGVGSGTLIGGGGVGRGLGVSGGAGIAGAGGASWLGARGAGGAAEGAVGTTVVGIVNSAGVGAGGGGVRRGSYGRK